MPAKSRQTVAQYLRGLDPERRAILTAVRKVVNQHMPAGYAEGMSYGMIAWSIPLREFPNTYNGEPLCYAGLAAKKNYLTLHLMAAYGDPKQAAFLREEFAKRGKKLDMGKACVRFKTLDDLPLDVIASVVASMPPKVMMDAHEAVHAKKRRRDS